MRRKSEQLFLLIERTVPVLLAIGAVLSVLSLLFREQSALLIACAVVWLFVLIFAVSDFVYTLILREKSVDYEEGSDASLQVLSEVAHELKTPLTVIRGSVEVLADGAVDAAQYGEYFDRILRETDAMTKLVSDLLNAARGESSQRFDPQTTDLSLLGRAVCDDLQDLAMSKGVELLFEAKGMIPLVKVDPDRVGQLAVILLDNALKHTPPKGRVTLSLEKKFRAVVLSVQDNGNGISSRDLPHIFDRYYKVPVERGGQPSGSGIGLSVAKSIVRLHGGTIKVTSKIGKGTRFTVRFPL